VTAYIAMLANLACFSSGEKSLPSPVTLCMLSVTAVEEISPVMQWRLRSCALL
jgi:hypothetical protein